MTSTILHASAILWAMCHLIGIAIAVRLWRRERRAAYAWFAISWASMAIAGLAVIDRAAFGSMLAITVVAVTVVVASITGLVALWTLAQLARSRMVYIYTTRDGDIVGRAHHDLEIEHDTIPPPS